MSVGFVNLIWIFGLNFFLLNAEGEDDLAVRAVKRSYKYIPDSPAHSKSLDLLRSISAVQHLDEHHPIIQDLYKQITSRPLQLVASSSNSNLSVTYGTGALPTPLDMTNGYPPPFDQGQLGSCTSNFESNTVAETGVVPMPNTVTEQLLGGHAVAFAGYDDSKSCFLMRNSWGTSWGTGNVASGVRGYFWMPYAYILSTTLARALWKIGSVGAPPAVTAYLAGHDVSIYGILTRYGTLLIGGSGNFNGLNLTKVNGTTTVVLNIAQTGASGAANTAATVVNFPSFLKNLKFTGNANGMDTVCTTAANALPRLISTLAGCTLRFSLTTGPSTACNWFASSLPSNWLVLIDANCADPMLSSGILDQAIVLNLSNHRDKYSSTKCCISN